MKYTAIGFFLGMTITFTLSVALSSYEYSGIFGIITGILICAVVFAGIYESEN